jgi:hypothetical protein
MSIERHAADLVVAARRFQSAAEHPGGHAEAPDALVWIEEALQVLSAAWYQLAADAAPLSRDPEATSVRALQDAAAAFAQCARGCRRARRAVSEQPYRRDAADPMTETVG